MSTPPVRPGDILARKYRVERVLGMGAMGVVVAATHVDLGQVVALKHMHSGKAASPEQRARFLREARAAVLLKSHHVARVLDVGAQEDEAPYIVMEFLEGQDLDALLKARGRRPFEEAVEYVLQACEAMGEAHAAGIVHRDLKPANLFLTHDVSGEPCVKVLDFGISKLADAELALTSETQSLGSPLYMSPEQMSSSKSVDARSDVWALGIILYQLVAGQTPFHSASLQELYYRVLMGEPTPLGEHRPDAPPGFEEIILRCLERDRERRFRDVAELAAAIAPYGPAHARVYAERVARVVYRKGSRAVSSPDSAGAPAYRPSSPSFPEATAAVPSAPTPVGIMAESPARSSQAAPPSPPPAALEASPSPPTAPEGFRPTAPSVPTVGADSGVALSSTATTSSPLKQRRRALLIGLGCFVGSAILAGFFVAREIGRTSADQASSSTPAAPVTATASARDPSVTVEPSGAVPLPPPNSTGIAGEAPTGSPGAPAPTATAAASSSAVAPHPTAKPSGSRPKPPPTKLNPYDR
jgi:serine/threonine-protein kinase